MIEIAIKIAQKPNGGIAITFIPDIVEPATDKEQFFASVAWKMLSEAVAPALTELAEDLGGKSSTLTGDKAIFLADQMGFLGDAPQDPEKN